MKDKFSDNILNTDGVSEHDQKPTEEGKIKLLDVVALTQDVPEHNLKRGEVGTVVEILANGEAFEIEFSDDNGQMYKCLSFPASQLEVFHQEPIKADSKRQATDSIEGYRYQILHSVNAWLDLADDDILHLEVAEDFDIESDGTFTATQVKHTQDNITLRSEQVIAAINNYWKLRTNNPDRRVKVRLLTKSKIVAERGNSLGMDKPGLEVWSRCSGDEAVIQKISEFLQTDGKISEEVNDFLKVASPQEIYEQLIEPITWDTNCKDAGSVEQNINRKLISHGNQLGFLPSEARKALNALLKEAFMVATRKENRRLTKARFYEIFEEQTTQAVPTQHLRHLQRQATLAAALDPASTALIGDAPDITIQLHSPIQTVIPPLYPNVAPRTDLLTSIQTKFQSDNIVIIQGGVDKGKTTLAKLAANAIDGSWCWLNLREKDPTQVTQLLQQLDIGINNQSSQINVVLDDLNLQPQQLQAYEEILGMVMSSVQTCGIKLLITSQHKPPNNFIRILGLSSAIIDKLDFTSPEIEQFAKKMACPTEDVETWVTLIQAHTGGHPRLVHALLTELRERKWKEQNIIESILQTPSEVLKERESARQLLMSLPEDRREFLYRLSLLIEFRKDYAINIGEIPVPISHAGDVFSQLVGPWIDQINETYYTVSPLLTNAAKEVWSDGKINDLHAEVANAILKANNLTPIEARSVFLHSIIGRNREGLVAVIWSLITASQDDWEIVSKEFSFLIPMKIDLPEKLYLGDAFVKYLIRFLQYRITAKVKPGFAPKILEVWDEETKTQQQSQEYQLLRRMLAMEALRYNQVLLPVKQMVDYLQEIIEITDGDAEVEEIHGNFMEQIKKHKTDKSSIFSILFSFVYTRPPVYAPFLNDLIDALDDLDSKSRDLLLADFKGDSVESRILIDGVWLSEANLDEPNWTRCLHVFDKVIERAIVWGYPHIAAASARGKAIIHDEKLNVPDTAHRVLQDITSKVGPLPVIEEEQALVYFAQERYREALNIYERLLPEWNPPSEQLGIGPLEEYRRAAICAASLNDWKRAAIFLEEGAKRTQEIEKTERYIGLYADAGFAQFKAGNMLDSTELLNLALQKFEALPQNNTDVRYFTLKQRLIYTTRQIVALGTLSQNHDLEFEELPVGFCSNPDTDEKVLDLPDSPIGETWVNLAQIEYKFGDKTTIFQKALQIADRNAYPMLDIPLSLLETRYDFKNKTFDNLPQRVYQLAKVYASGRKHEESGRGIGEKESYSISISDLHKFAYVENITVILVPALITQLVTGQNTQEILSIWRTNSSELPIKDNIFTTLDLIESMLFGDQNSALTVLKTQENKFEERIVAALKVVENKEIGLGDLLYAHTFITMSFIGKTWEDFVVTDLAELLSAQWLEKKMDIPIRAVSQVEKACNSNETGKKKIGQILLAVLQAISPRAPSEMSQKFRSWIESESR